MALAVYSDHIILYYSVYHNKILIGSYYIIIHIILFYFIKFMYTIVVYS